MAAIPKFTGLTPKRSGGRPAAAPAKAMRKPATRPTQQNDAPRSPMPPLLPPQPMQLSLGSGRTYVGEAARAGREQAFHSALFATAEDRQAASSAVWQAIQQPNQADQPHEEAQARNNYSSGNEGAELLNSYLQHTTTSPANEGAELLNSYLQHTTTSQPAASQNNDEDLPVLGILDRLNRAVVLRNASEMTQQEYEALSPRQQAAIQFNTGLVEASRLDHETRAGSTENTEAFLASMGITPAGQSDLNRYLNLEYLISPDTIALMDDPANGAQTPQSSLGHVPGEISPQQQLVSDARNHSLITAGQLSNSLATSGSGTLSGQRTPIPGFGNTIEDAIIQDVYLQMIDSSKNWTTQDIVAGIAADNAAMGTNVTPEQVWGFTRANIEAVEFGSLGSRQERLRGSGTNLATGIELTPLDIAEIRARYGL